MKLDEIPTAELRAELERRENGQRFVAIIRACADAWRVHPLEIVSRSTRHVVSDARTCAMAMAYAAGGATYADIALAFRKADTSTIGYAIRRHEDRMEGDETYRERATKAQALNGAAQPPEEGRP